MSVYVGIAEAARDAAVGLAEGKGDDPYTPFLMGELECEVATARNAWTAMVANANEYDFDLGVETANVAFVNKTVCGRAALAAAEKALEASGGRGFYKRTVLERLVRDAHASPYHPLPDKKQALFSGRLALGCDPITGRARYDADGLAKNSA